jgi:hypothetical protein
VYAEDAPRYDADIFRIGIPVLGNCVHNVTGSSEDFNCLCTVICLSFKRTSFHLCCVTLSRFSFSVYFYTMMTQSEKMNEYLRLYWL